jgi:transcription-repair coupling factor (superfamily II helicase)
MVTDAINREIARDGQIYYLYNRVQTIERKFEDLRKMVPDARIAIAHGQMREHELENTMVDFSNGEYDILLCTTIVESGLDIPNVNTIIVENADKMGLAQLYQLRGRVGRAERLAHAYITYKKDKILSEVAEKRLAAIREFTEFGSGFKIALRDLEIRGAGNIIGGEQHGHMDAVGYDTYCRLLQQAISEEQGISLPAELKAENEDVTIDIDINAFIPAEYIPSDEQKIQMYKHISLINNEADASDVQDELMDRYGEIPNEVNELIYVALTKSFCAKYGIISVKKSGDAYLLRYGKSAKINMDALSNAISKTSFEVIFSLSGQPELRLKSNKKTAQSAAIVNFLKLLQ